MLPIVLNVQQRRVVVVGRGYGAEQRYAYARDAGVEQLSLYVVDQDGWACHAEAALYERLPVRADLQNAAVVLIAGLDADETAHLAALAREAGALVNAEDNPELCDFHVPATVRRGDLLLTASTGGTAPGLAKRVAAYLQDIFPSEWSQWTRKVANERERWRAEGRSKSDVARLTDGLVDREGWLRARADA